MQGGPQMDQISGDFLNHKWKMAILLVGGIDMVSETYFQGSNRHLWQNIAEWNYQFF